MARLFYLAAITSFALSAVAHPAESRHNVIVKRKKITSHQTECGKDCDLGNTSSASHAVPSSGEALNVEALFPQEAFLEGWTVSGKSHPNAKSLLLGNNTFIVEKEIKDLKHPVVEVDGRRAIHAHQAKGAYDLRSSPAGGFSFYTPGPKGPNGKPLVDLTKAKEVSLSYSVKFSAGYGFNLGGKLPGLYGGVTDDIAATCSGGHHDGGCFSTRFMFRSEGKGELYLYIPPHLNRKNFCGIDGNGKCRGASPNGVTYGASVGTGLWHFKAGEFTTVREVIRLNTPGKRDGYAQVYVNGSPDPILDVQDIAYRSSKNSKFRGIQCQTFHGGHEPVWAAPHDQDVFFADFSVAVMEYDV